MAKEIFDYSKVSPNDYAYYGFHLKNGRYHIDTKRLKKLHCDDSFPDGLFNLPRNTHYFLPKHKFEKEWAINVLKAYLNKLSSDWNKEFKTVISKITTPKTKTPSNKPTQAQNQPKPHPKKHIIIP